MDKHGCVVRLHLWLETEAGMLFGSGRAQLLDGIERHGSLNKAAREMGMSYRAAWGKIKQAEEAMGIQLVEKSGNCRDGCHLTDAGRIFKEKYEQWFAEVEQIALIKARDIFPWPLCSYPEFHTLRNSSAQKTESKSPRNKN